MYVPGHFKLESIEAVRTLMAHNPFATIVSNGPEAPFATHIPVLVEEGDELAIAGHIAKANPHWKLFADEKPMLAIFHGPHAYVSPALYVN